MKRLIAVFGMSALMISVGLVAMNKPSIPIVLQQPVMPQKKPVIPPILTVPPRPVSPFAKKFTAKHFINEADSTFKIEIASDDGIKQEYEIKPQQSRIIRYNKAIEGIIISLPFAQGKWQRKMREDIGGVSTNFGKNNIITVKGVGSFSYSEGVIPEPWVRRFENKSGSILRIRYSLESGGEEKIVTLHPGFSADITFESAEGLAPGEKYVFIVEFVGAKPPKDITLEILDPTEVWEGFGRENVVTIHSDTDIRHRTDKTIKPDIRFHTVLPRLLYFGNKNE